MKVAGEKNVWASLLRLLPLQLARNYFFRGDLHNNNMGLVIIPLNMQNTPTISCSHLKFLRMTSGGTNDRDKNTLLWSEFIVFLV